MTKLTIRPALAADYPGVEALWREQNAFHAALEPARIQVVDDCLPRADFDAHLQSRDREIAVAAQDGAVVGFALLVERQHRGGWAVPMAVAFVQEICVAQRLRGAGIGRRLMAYVDQWAQRRSLAAVELNVWANNRSAVAFYRELGFAPLRHEFVRAVAEP